MILTTVFGVEVADNATLDSGYDTQNESPFIQMQYALNTCCQLQRVTVTCTLAVSLVHLVH